MKDKNAIKFPKIVNRAQWQKAREAILVKEKRRRRRGMRWRRSGGGCRW